jgi:hypothetical protein
LVRNSYLKSDAAQIVKDLTASGKRLLITQNEEAKLAVQDVHSCEDTQQTLTFQGSRWGMRGTEDLGGGLKAIFLLENGFDASTGKLWQGGLEFGRQAWVGLSSARLGTVSLGRQYARGWISWGGWSRRRAGLAHSARIPRISTT